MILIIIPIYIADIETAAKAPPSSLSDSLSMTKSTFSLFLVLLFLSVVSLLTGAADVTMRDILALDAHAVDTLVISRLPRLLAILCAGAGMAIAGLLMQQLCANKFVSPTTGATISSAQLGILVALLFFPDSNLWERAFFAFAAALAGTWIFVWFVMRMPMKDVVMVPLVGIMFGNVIGGVTNFLAFKYDMVQALQTWLVGHFSLVLKGNYELVYLVAPLIVLSFIYAKQFNIVGMGKDFSKNLGVPYGVVLLGGLSIAAMMTASVVTVVGAISYIGLIVPNVVSLFKGDDLRATMVDTALTGAVFVLACDLVGRSLIAPYELPIELIVGSLGSLLFIGLIFYRLRFGRRSVGKDTLLKLFGLTRAQNPTVCGSCGTVGNVR